MLEKSLAGCGRGRPHSVFDSVMIRYFAGRGASLTLGYLDLERPLLGADSRKVRAMNSI